MFGFWNWSISLDVEYLYIVRQWQDLSRNLKADTQRLASRIISKSVILLRKESGSSPLRQMYVAGHDVC